MPGFSDHVSLSKAKPFIFARIPGHVETGTRSLTLPRYRHWSVLDITRNLRAFLNLDAGLTRGEIPDDRQKLRQAKTRIEQQDRELVELRKPGNQDRSQNPAWYGPITAGGGLHEPLRIVHVGLDDIWGGAGRAAYKLHNGLRRLGHESSMFVANKRSGDPTIRAFEPPTDPQSQREHERRKERIEGDFALYGDSRPKHLIGDGFTGDRSVHGAAPLEQLPGCDVVNLHWFGSFFDYRAFFSTVPQEVPVVWTLHDMNAFTGGCHYDDYCGKFSDRCGACPQLGSTVEEDLSRQVWNRKSEAFAGVEDGRLRLVAVSNWLAGEASRSSLLGRFPVTSISPSLDSQVFAPRDRSAARANLGIPEEASVLLFIADSLVTRRKGFALLAEALEGLAGVPDLFLLSLGHNNPAGIGDVPHLHLDYIEDDLALSAIYSAADVFVMPSLQEAFGQTVLEALACGTPVIGFDVGGIPEMVRPGVTGELVQPGDIEGLRNTIRALLKDPERRAEMSANGRRMAVEEFAHDVQAGRYADLYRSLLKDRAK